MKRLAVIDNTKLKDMSKKVYIQGLCPVNRAGKECMYFEGSKLLIAEPLCIGCGICSNVAPEAIKIINLPDTLAQDPIHRYGKNGFALYNLPTPLFGKVVGILGVNGIGKSTAIQIIAGILKPSFGKEKEASMHDLIQHFKGTETQAYFEKMKSGSIKVAYKPQHVDLIPKQFSGKVIELLKKVDEVGTMEAVAAQFELTHLLERELGQISGGELQRVAIAATFLKKANVYIFDEITSYLDISQRLKVAKAIRGLATPDVAVVVIEHDLIALDYMADLIHLMYGTQKAFGVVSQVKPAKYGINVFLEGYLKEENVRFRDSHIKFSVRAPIKSIGIHTLTEWHSFEKVQGDFTLHAEGGKIRPNERIGVLGENGIGKTTFVKILAGVEKATSGELGVKLKVSYKPQYLEADSDELVMSALHEAVKKYDAELIRPLGLKDLLLKKLNELSGGELQRVAIAQCLSQPADLFLLDEPSAYLDVEQRLAVSKIISNLAELRHIAVLVVDHDLLFLDYLADRLMVFTGKSGREGKAQGPFDLETGMNTLLSSLGITMRRDESSKRPRINKLGSVKDREQKEKNKYYYG
ncbi:ribosome biogenesis/translation initiation ATPase RLI [Candidatus Woesearchaeota archaeon]|nr:ribosome biogenesis/translation initiation ATPase RLI [Candidatus Woesearchaeota archaeon]